MIDTARLFIRPFEAQDGNALYEYLSKPDIYQFEPGEPVTLKEAKELALERSQGTDFYAVILKDKSKLVGHLYFSQILPNRIFTWELGYIFNPLYHLQGYATEAAIALVQYGFDNLSVHRVVAYCNPENIASVRVLEKIGMRREGHFRKNMFFHESASGTPLWNDTFVYAILREDICP